MVLRGRISRVVSLPVGFGWWFQSAQAEPPGGKGERGRWRPEGHLDLPSMLSMRRPLPGRWGHESAGAPDAAERRRGNLPAWSPNRRTQPGEHGKLPRKSRRLQVDPRLKSQATKVVGARCDCLSIRTGTPADNPEQRAKIHLSFTRIYGKEREPLQSLTFMVRGSVNIRLYAGRRK